MAVLFAFLSGLWLLCGLPIAVTNLVNLFVQRPKDKLLCAVAGLPGPIRAEILSYVGHTKFTKSLLKDRFFYRALYQDAFIRHTFSSDLFIGLIQSHEYFCFMQIAEEAKCHLKNGTLEAYMEHKYPLLGDIGLNLNTFHVLHDHQDMSLHWLKNAHLSQAERIRAFSVLLLPRIELRNCNYVSYWVRYSGIRPCIQSGPQSFQFEMFFQLTNPEYLGAVMASDSSTPLPDTILFTTDVLDTMYYFFGYVPSTHCSSEEHRAMYFRNDEFIRRNLSEDQSWLVQFITVNLVKHGHAEIIKDQDPSLLQTYLAEAERCRASRLMHILAHICDMPNEVNVAWMDLLEKCNLSQMEYETFFAPDRQPEKISLFLEANQGMRDGIIDNLHLSHQSRSDIPVCLWYKAMLIVVTGGHACEFNNLIAAYRLAKMKNDKNAMVRFANMAIASSEWTHYHDIWEVPMDPVFMKGILEHRLLTGCHFRYCFAYAVVHNLTEVIGLVFQKLLQRHQRDSSTLERFCREMLRDGYIPEAYIADFENVTARLMELVR